MRTNLQGNLLLKCLKGERVKSLNRKKHNGFSLMEIVITISIIVVLTLISGPIYKGYSDKVVLAEGYALLGTIRSAQEAYYNDTGNFLSFYESSGKSRLTCNEEVLGIDARPNKYYTSFCVNHSVYDHNVTFVAQVYGPQWLYMKYNRTTGVTME